MFSEVWNATGQNKTSILGWNKTFKKKKEKKFLFEKWKLYVWILAKPKIEYELERIIESWKFSSLPFYISSIYLPKYNLSPKMVLFRKISSSISHLDIIEADIYYYTNTISLLSKRRLTLSHTLYHIKTGKLVNIDYNLKIHTDRNGSIWFKIFREKQEIISMFMKYYQYYNTVY